ncbi:MAG: SGNH/GDSL hydrolase family protein [Candidatus Nitrosotenuis sp.]
MKYKSIINNILVLLLSIFILFVIGEILIRFYLNKKIIYDIEMTRYSLLIKQDHPNPQIGHVHRPNISAKLMNVMVNINSDGLRDKEYSVKKSNKYRIIFLGDSLTFGWGVPKEATFEAILEEKLNELYPTEVLNFGTGNYNTEQEVSLFIEKGLKYRPDKVVLFYFINDAEPTPVKSRLWFLGYSRLLSFYWSRIHSTISNIFRSKSFYDYYSNLYNDNQPGWLTTQKSLLQLKRICKENGIKLQVVLLPELHNPTNNYPFNKEYNKVKSFLKTNGINYLDVTPAFQDYVNPIKLWVAEDDAHPNSLAHRIIANYIFDFVADNRN